MDKFSCYIMFLTLIDDDDSYRLVGWLVGWLVG